MCIYFALYLPAKQLSAAVDMAFTCKFIVVAVVLTVALLPYVSPAPTNKLPPFVLVPGDGGSQYEAKLDKPSVVHWLCTKKTIDWFPLWLNLELLAPYAVDCFVDNMKLQYNNVSGTTSNQPGVQIRQPGFGNTSTVEWLDSSHLSYTSYFQPIVDFLVKNFSYVRGENVRGAPYDFRKAPNEMSTFLKDLEQLIIRSYEENGNQPVILLGHSMGNLYVHYLLTHQSHRWKRKYIKTYISLAGPWAGAVKSVHLEISGDNLGVFVVNNLKARIEQRSMPSTAWLLPYDTFWNSSEIVVYSPGRNYTVNDYQQLFADIGFPDGYQMRKDTEKLSSKLEPPEVEVHCLHGVGIETPGALVYTSSTNWFDHSPTVINDDGDGTVNIRSLHGCLQWSSKQSEKVHHQEFKGVYAEHLQMLKNPDIIAYIAKVVSS